MEDTKIHEKIVKQLIEPLSVETFLKLKDFRRCINSIGTSDCVLKNKKQGITIAIWR